MTEDDACTVCKLRARVAGQYRCSQCVAKAAVSEILRNAPRPQRLDSWS